MYTNVARWVFSLCPLTRCYISSNGDAAAHYFRRALCGLVISLDPRCLLLMAPIRVLLPLASATLLRKAQIAFRQFEDDQIRVSDFNQVMIQASAPMVRVYRVTKRLVEE